MSDVADNQAMLLQFSADNAKMLRAFETAATKVGAYADQIERRTKKMAEKVEEHGRLSGEGFGKALERVFSASRLTVLEEGAARISVFGGALEALGPIGLGAAAGIGAFTLTMEHTDKAIEYAAGVAKVSKEVGVTTDFIQKFNFAAHQNEIQVTAADGSLKKLNESLGLVQAGLARTQLSNAFKAVGFTPEQLRQFHDVGDFFPVLAGRIAKIGDAAEQAAVAKRLGIEELLPMLKDGADGFATLAQKAEDLGIVMDHGTIERAEEAKRKLNELDDVMKAKANETFAQFADTIIAVKEAFLGAEKAVLGFLAAITGTMPSTIESVHKLQAEIARLTDKNGNPTSAFFAGTVAQDRANLARIQKELEEAKKEQTPSAKSAAKQLVPDKAKAKPADQTASFDKSATDALNSAKEAEAKALASLVVGIQAHADAEKAAVDRTLEKKLADLEAEAQKIAKAKNDADKLAQRAKINSAKAAEQEAAETEKRVIDQKAATAALEQFLSYSQGIRGDYARIAANSAAMADTAAERSRIEREELIKQQAFELKQFDLRAKDELSKLSGTDLDSRRSELAAERASKVDANTSDLARLEFNNAKPLDQYLHSIRDLNTAFQQDGVTFVQDMTSGLVTLAAQGKLTAQSLENIFLSLLIKMAAQSAEEEAAPALAGVFKAGLSFLGLAGGGRVAGPGSATSDSIPTMLSDGEFVVKASAASRYLPVLEAINSGRALHRAGGGMVGSTLATLGGIADAPAPRVGGVTVLQELHFHAEHAVVAQELLDQAASTSRREAVAAGQAARAGALSDMQRVGYLNNLNSGG
jgi:hypothetical protein